MSEAQQAVGVANALTNERSFHTVHYPITGDEELDTLSGLLAVLGQEQIGGRPGRLSYERTLAILAYLLDRYRRAQKEYEYQKAKAQERMSNPLDQLRALESKFPIGSGIGYPLQTPAQSPPLPATTTAGTPSFNDLIRQFQTSCKTDNDPNPD